MSSPLQLTEAAAKSLRTNAHARIIIETAKQVELVENLGQPPQAMPPDMHLRMDRMTSPLLSTKEIEGLMQTLPTDSSARASLMANPNCPPSRVTPGKLMMEDRKTYQEALSLYGDLASTRTSDELNQLFIAALIPSARLHKKRHGLKCMSNLIARIDLTSALALKLDQCATPELFQELAKTAVHRQLVKEQAVSGYNKFTESSEKRMVISPEVPTEQLATNFANTAPDAYDARRALAAHQNALPEMVKNVIDSNDPGVPDEFTELLVTNQSPNAEDALLEIRTKHPHSKLPPNLGDLAKVSTVLLLESLAEASSTKEWDVAVKTMCNPKFPWKRGSQLLTRIKENLSKESLMLVQATRALTGIATDEDFTNAKADIHAATALLFAPNLSSHRIGKLAETHPPLAPLAAVHPNGFDVPTEKMAPEIRTIVEKARYEPLSGHSNSVPSGKSSILVI